jgi:hypothetical protein
MSKYWDRNQRTNLYQMIGTIIVISLFHACKAQVATDPDATNKMKISKTVAYLTDTSLVGHWRFDESAGDPTVVDASGNGNDGTLVYMDLNNCRVTGRMGNALTSYRRSLDQTGWRIWL